MTDALSSCLALLADVALKSALLAAIAALALWILRVRNSAVRHRVWTLVLFGMLALPLVVQLAPCIYIPSAVFPYSLLQTGINPPTRETSASIFATPAISTATRVAGDTEQSKHISATNAGPPAANTQHTAIDTVKHDSQPAIYLPTSAVAQNELPAATYWHFALAVLYAAGIAYFSARLLIALRRARALIQSSQPLVLAPNFAQRVGATPVLESPTVRVPITIGCWRPSILLPLDWSTWSQPLLASALAHEQAHVARRDQWIALLAECNRALYWFHPLAWFLRHRLSALAEECCDDAVISLSGDRTQYARHLLEVAARLAGSRGRVQPAGVAMARIPQVERRINAILDASRPLARRMSVRGLLAMLGVALPVILLVAALKANEQKPPRPVPVRDRERGAETIASESPPSGHANRTQAREFESSTAKSPATREASSNATTKPQVKQLRGRVVMKSDNSPVAKAEVRLVTRTDNSSSSRTAISNDRGEFVFDGVISGNHRLVVFFGDFSSRDTRYNAHTVDLTADEPVTLALSKMPSINVRVVSQADGAPVADALVRLPWSDTTHDHRTDKDGRVTLPCLTPEVWHIEVHAKGFAEKEVPVNLAGGDAANVTIELDAGGAGVLFGTITDEAGNPVAGAGFSVFPANFSGQQIEYKRTDGQGNYRFDYLPVNQGLELSVSGSGFLDLREQVKLTAGAERSLDLVLLRRPHGGTVSGSVSDTAGNPIAGATLTNHGRSSRDKRTATTDELGIFLLDDVYEGSIGHELVVKAEGFAPQHVKFRPGTQQSPAKIAITLEAGHRIRGRVVDEAGKALRGVAVYFANGNRGSGMEFGGKTTTDADGRFEFDSLPKVCPFAFVADGYSEIEDATLPLDGDEEVLVTMQSEGVIQGRVVDAETGKPISSFNVQITFSPDRKPDEPGHHLSGPRATSPDGERFANDEGAFVLKDLIREMPLQVTVEADGYDRHIKRRVVAASASAAETIEFRLRPIDTADFFTIRGRIVDNSKRPITGAELRLISTTDIQLPREFRHQRGFSFVKYPFGWQMIRSGSAEKAAGVRQFLSTTSNENGQFAFEQVRPAAAMQIAYWGDGITQGRVEGIEQLTDAEREDVKIEVVAPGIVRGTIDRKALPSIQSIAVSPQDRGSDSDIQHAFLKAGQATYEIRNVPPGKYQLQVYGELVRVEGTDGYTQDVVQRHDIEVRSGEALSFNLGDVE